MSTQQPVWKQVAQLGDVNPLDYGGLFVYVDQTGVYPPEMERVERKNEDDESEGWEIRRVPLDNLKLVSVDGAVYLVPARYDETWPNPLASYDQWFHSDLERVANFVDRPLEELRSAFVSEDPKERARAWQAVGDYHGWDDLDAYPFTFTDREELEKRYR